MSIFQFFPLFSLSTLHIYPCFVHTSFIMNINIHYVYLNLTVILVAFSEDIYNVSEGNTVKVCVEIVSGDSVLVPFDGFLDFTVFTNPDTASGM